MTDLDQEIAELERQLAEKRAQRAQKAQAKEPGQSIYEAACRASNLDPADWSLVTARGRAVYAACEQAIREDERKRMSDPDRPVAVGDVCSDESGRYVVVCDRLSGDLWDCVHCSECDDEDVVELRAYDEATIKRERIRHGAPPALDPDRPVAVGDVCREPIGIDSGGTYVVIEQAETRGRWVVVYQGDGTVASAVEATIKRERVR